MVEHPATRPAGAPVDLGDGSVLRLATAEDLDAVVDLTARVFGDHDAAPVRAYLTGDTGAEWLVVEDRATGALVSCSARIPHRFRLDGHAVPGSQIEYVVTDPARRHQGLVRAQFDAHHARARAAGEMAQFVGGIPYLYRRFGYGYAHDHPLVFVLDRPPRPAEPGGGGGRPDTVARPATGADRPWLVATERARPVLGLRAERDLATFEVWEAMTRSSGPGSSTVSGAFGRPGGTFDALDVLERHGQRVGWLRAHAIDRSADLYVLAAWAADADAATALLDHVHDLGRRAAATFGSPVTVVAYDSPGTVWADELRRHAPGLRLPTGTYGRVEDPLALLRQLRPLLDERLADSPLRTSTGSLVLSTYVAGITLAWADGRLSAIEAAPADPDPFGHGGVGVAPDWFPALVWGRWGARGLAERADDVMLGHHAEAMQVLFPARPSDLGADF